MSTMDLIIAFIAIFFSIVLTQNFVLSQFLGICPFVGVSKDTSSAFGMGMAVTFVMTLASLVTWILSWFILAENSLVLRSLGIPADLLFLKTIVFILVIASLVQFVEMAVAKVAPALYKSLGIFLPLITTNCAVLGVAIMNMDKYILPALKVDASPMTSLLVSMVGGFAAGISFLVAIVPMAGIRERLEISNVPKPFRGLPITFVCAALMAMAFLGFVNLISPVKLF